MSPLRLYQRPYPGLACSEISVPSSPMGRTLAPTERAQTGDIRRAKILFSCS